MEEKNEFKKIKDKLLGISKRNILRIITVCFWGYMIFSSIPVLIEVVFTPNWSQALEQYSRI